MMSSLLLLSILFISHTAAFLFTQPTKRGVLSVHSSTDDWNVPSDDELNVRPQRSQIPDYIAAYLRKENPSPQFLPTHMVGIPIDSCHELLIELESVQRAILYHCPVLVHSCIVGSVTRLPLLYVDASYQPSGRVTYELQQLTERVVKKFYFTTKAEADENNLNGAGNEGYPPLTLNFHKLEVDGDKHDVLYTKAVKGEEGTTKLIALVQDLKQEIEKKGWTVQCPSNPHETEFLPRIPFMRLPEDFNRHLEDIPANDFHTPEQGGNGISPIFWCKWWDDYMGRSVRLREVGIYPKRPGYDGMDESAFYIPHETIAFPDGNAKLKQLEKKHATYNEERMTEVEGLLDQEEADKSDAIFDPSLEGNRKFLESLYESESILTDGLVSIGNELVVESTRNEESSSEMQPDDDDERIKQNAVIEQTFSPGPSSPYTERALDTPAILTTNESPSREPLSDWMETRIRQIVESRESVLKRGVDINMDGLPSIEDNAILNAFKAGTLVDKTASLSTTAKARETPPFPSREAFVGFWKVMQSPSGVAEEICDGTQTDNLVLRVDGTTSGGPILNPEFRQRAAGGTWAFFKNDDGSIWLRIRLVVPPKKDRILVMEGLVLQGCTSIDLSASLLSSTAFGKKQDDNKEGTLQCRGSVWLEDAVTKRNRKEIGTFFLTKLETSIDPRDYTITIPNPVRSQD